MFCTKSAMNDVVYGHMAMISTGTMTTAEPMGCNSVYIGSKYTASMWFINRNTKVKTYSNTNNIIQVETQR